MMMFPAFLALVKPVSTMAKPGCIKNTINAPISTHIVSAAAYFSIIIVPPHPIILALFIKKKRILSGYASSRCQLPQGVL